MIRLEDIIGKDVITEDARILGTIESVGLDISEWQSPAFKITVKKGMEAQLGVKKPMFASAKVYLKTGCIESVSDMVTLKVKLDGVKEELLTITDDDIDTAGEFINRKVVAKGGIDLGILESFLIDNDDWEVPLMEVRLTKQAIKDMGLKKGFRYSRVVSMETGDIRTVGDMVLLGIDKATVRSHIEGTRRRKREKQEERVDDTRAKEVSLESLLDGGEKGSKGDGPKDFRL